MAVEVTLHFDSAGWAKVWAGNRQKIAKATHGAIRDAAALIQQGGRESIQSGGFKDSSYWPWVSGLTCKVLSTPANSVSASAVVHHSIGFAAVFEHGATIKGRPFLWIPLSSTPKTISGQPTTPKRWSIAVGPVRGGRPSKRGTPLLWGPLSRGANAEVPLFFGTPSVTIRKKFDVQGVADRVRAQLPDLYARNFEGS